jgi:hypothetical protein
MLTLKDRLVRLRVLQGRLVRLQVLQGRPAQLPLALVRMVVSLLLLRALPLALQQTQEAKQYRLAVFRIPGNRPDCRRLQKLHQMITRRE